MEVSMQIVCPHCQAEVDWDQTRADQDVDRVHCESCSNSFLVRIKRGDTSVKLDGAGRETFQWYVRKVDGTLLSFPTDTRFKEGIVKGLVDLDDEVSGDGRTWTRIDTVPLIAGFMKRWEDLRAEVPQQAPRREGTDPEFVTGTGESIDRAEHTDDRTTRGVDGAERGAGTSHISAQARGEETMVFLPASQAPDPDLVESAKRIARHLAGQESGTSAEISESEAAEPTPPQEPDEAGEPLPQPPPQAEKPMPDSEWGGDGEWAPRMEPYLSEEATGYGIYMRRKKRMYRIAGLAVAVVALAGVAYLARGLFFPPEKPAVEKKQQQVQRQPAAAEFTADAVTDVAVDEVVDAASDAAPEVVPEVVPEPEPKPKPKPGSEARGFDGFMARGNELRRSNPGKATGWYLKALEKKPGHPEANYKLGDCYYRMGRHANAIKYFDKAIAASGFRAAYTRIAQSYAATGRRQKAVKYLEQGLKRYPGDALMESMLSQYR